MLRKQYRQALRLNEVLDFQVCIICEFVGFHSARPILSIVKPVREIQILPNSRC